MNCFRRACSPVERVTSWAQRGLTLGRLRALIPPAVLVGLWWAAAATWPVLLAYLRRANPGLAVRLPDITFLSSPPQTAASAVHLLTEGQLGRHTLWTLGRTVAAFGIAASVGGIFGAYLSRGSSLARTLHPTVEGVRSIPPIALLPLFILAAGVGEALPVLFAAFGAVWPVTIAAFAAVSRVDPLALEVAKNLRMTPRQIARRVVLPLALPGFFTGLRISLPLSFILVIVVEMLVSGSGIGLGTEIDYARRSFRFDDMIALIVTVGATGFILNWCFCLLEKKVLWWDPRFREGPRRL